jgi:putative membrane protein
MLMNAFCKCVFFSTAISCAGVALAASSASDRDFAAKAARDGAREVELGKLAVQRSDNEAIKSFGQQMVDDHTKAGEELKAAAEQSGIDLPNETAAAKPDSALEKLDGAKFDETFARTMVEDHRKAVAMFQHEAEDGGDPNLKMFAKKTLPTLRHHLQMAEELPNRGQTEGSDAPQPR